MFYLIKNINFKKGKLSVVNDMVVFHLSNMLKMFTKEVSKVANYRNNI